MKSMCIMIILTLFVASSAVASDYSINVTRKGKNLYKWQGEDVFIYTKHCYEYAYSEKAFLSMSGVQGKVTFSNSGSSCDVKGVYVSSEQSSGDYSIRVSQESDDWYEVSGTNLFVRTSSCMSMAMGSKATLSIGAGGGGSINIDGRKCTVEEVYERISL